MTENVLSLQKMQVISCIVLAVMTLASAVLVSLWFAWSVFAGGLVSIASFWVSNKDVMRLIHSVTSIASPEDRKAQAQQGQKGYLLKFWLRIVLIGIVLLFLIKSKTVNIFGLILGLSTVVIAITFISLHVAGHYFFRGRR
ncbi:ATP synthase subunit I [Desulfocastanea catecholica]